AFLEMSSHEEAVDMVNYHKENPAFLYGKPISFYLSKTLLVIEGGQHPAQSGGLLLQSAQRGGEEEGAADHRWTLRHCGETPLPYRPGAVPQWSADGCSSAAAGLCPPGCTRPPAHVFYTNSR
ncbi:unnamed protein product, partial [Tetraodon nigroviridis]